MAPENLHEFFHYLIYGQNKIENEDYHRRKRQRTKSLKTSNLRHHLKKGTIQTNIRFGYEELYKFKNGDFTFMEILNLSEQKDSYRTIKDLKAELAF